MKNKDLSADVNYISQCIDTYNELKDYEKKFTEDVKHTGNEIKQYMITNRLKSLESSSGKVTATITITPKESLDEERAIDILNALVVENQLTSDQLNRLIKTRQYIDEDALEDLIYHNDLDATVLAPAKIKRDPIYTLRLSKKK